MSRNTSLVLITGGAGFIGSHLADELLAHGYKVRALDNLDPQVHGEDRTPPDYLDPRVELQVGDVRDPDAVRRALRGVTHVVHFAAKVGVGQSMYQIREYTDVNGVGTGVLLEQCIDRPLKRLLVASSMSIYGEGLYRRVDTGETALAEDRTREQLKQGRWEPIADDGGALEPLPTPETKPPALSSVYAMSKYDQERMCLLCGGAYGLPATALRFFNVYGPRQALSNPYTGVLAIFASRLLNARPPMIFEDGEQRRDFVHVRDIARGCRLALERDEAIGKAINIGSGRSVTIREVAESLIEIMGAPPRTRPQILKRCRVGDIRHCFADISLARSALGYEPSMSFEEGLVELVGWLREQAADDHAEQAAKELERKGLTI